MRSDKQLAIQLRHQHKSYNEISKTLNIPKSTLSCWFSKLEWSKNFTTILFHQNNSSEKHRKQIQYLAKINRERWLRVHLGYQQQAKADFNNLKNNKLFLAGLMLYWGEGDSKIENSIVRLANTDPQMIRIFVLFLERICKIPKSDIKLAMVLYRDLDETSCKDFWSKMSIIPLNQFIKTQFIIGKHPTRRLDHGICTVYVTKRELKEKIFTWLHLYQQELYIKNEFN